MTKQEQVKHALKRCASSDCRVCLDCPYNDYDCTEGLFADTLQLINEQETENKQIRKKTAKEILDLIVYESGVDLLGAYYKLPISTYNKIKRKFGVEVEE